MIMLLILILFQMYLLYCIKMTLINYVMLKLNPLNAISDQHVQNC